MSEKPENDLPGRSSAGQRIGRRTLLKSAAALAGGGAAAAVMPSLKAGAEPVGSGPGMAAGGGPSVIALANEAIVTTDAGKVAGYIRKGIYTFKGIPYADTTEGVNRFMPPVKPKPWTEVRSSRQFGSIAPQGNRTGPANNDEEAFMFAWHDAVLRVYRAAEGEDCLRVNVWTPGINDGKKRPVMVWLHGGGYAYGSGQEQPSYDGENLARRGDVVVVTLNHRLNVFGFLNLAKFGDKYASSGSVSQLDIVAALEWVRDNIAGFGGDPGSVTVFGQSGGGGKVSMLMGMPSAKGLFHRGIVESGSSLRAGAPEPSLKLADLVVAELGLTASTIDQIQTMPFPQIQRASEDVLRRHAPPRGGASASGGPRGGGERLGFGPILDGKVLPAHPFDPRASALSADVPMIIGTTLNEMVNGMNHPEYEQMTSAELEQRVRERFGEKAPRILAAFRQRTPAAKPFDLWSHISASGMRGRAIQQATVKAAQGRAPAYLYWFTWQTPILNGRPRAFHCSEIAFVFDNTDLCDTMTGGGPDARALGARVSEAWIHFARTGNPNHPGIPRWTEFSPATVPTMIFDNRTELVNNPDGDEQKSIAEG